MSGVPLWWAPLLWALACAPDEAPQLSVQAKPGAVEVTASEPITQVAVVDATGQVLARRRVPNATEVVRVPLAGTSSRAHRALVRLAGSSEDRILSIDPLPSGPVIVTVQAPLGQDPQPIHDGDQLTVSVVEGSQVQVGVVAEVLQPGSVRLTLGDEERTWQRPTIGERLMSTAVLDQPLPVTLSTASETLRFSIAPRRISREEAQQTVHITAVDFPVERSGQPDLARAPNRITLPAPWWSALLRATSLGYRPHDPERPWGWQAVQVGNRGEQPLNVAIRSRVLDDQGQPAVPFRPRLRESDDGTGAVSALLRVPAGQDARAVLPLFLDEGQLSEAEIQRAGWTREISVTPLGSIEPLLVRRDPLVIRRGSNSASLGVLGALLASALGAALILFQVPRWVRSARTSDLTTIALFGTMSFVVLAASQLVGMAISTLLGPFAGLFTGLIDDLLRYSLLATLITLRPRPGTATLATVLEWLLRAIALGGFHPMAILFLTARVSLLEGSLWIFGLTRQTGWVESSRFQRFLRCSAGFGTASVASMAAGFAYSIVLYRLFLADWYIAAMLALPGFLYVVIAVAIATPFAESLRRVGS